MHGVALTSASSRLDLRALLAGEPSFAAAGVVMAVSLAATVPTLAFDPRALQGESIWLKPVKFQIALALYLLTLAAYARWLPAGLTRTRRWRWFSAAVVFACFAEIAWIGGAAAAGTGSHFNTATTFMSVLYGIMGALAVTLTAASLAMGAAILRDPGSPLTPPLREAVGLGLVLTFLLTVPVAGWMSQHGGHFVGDPAAGGRLPVLGWSTEVGDLRAAHFLATHALHVIPLVAWVLVALLPPAWAKPAVRGAVALYVASVAWTFAAALLGRPPIPA